MPTFHCDHLVQDAIQTAVASGTTYTSNAIPLSGVQAVSIQVNCSNGAAGTIYVDGCNQPVPSGNNQLSPSSPVTWLNCTSQVLTANQQAVLTYTLTDQITSMHNTQIRFMASAAGNVQISFNGRRLTD